ncbi:hypothetical protein EUX98_g9612 [Antrodiella citrinella]|uniref:Uncharacterized protein n=1 Tax=Antrodiella citrinella TaxID=2447956 RepID=A0A4S4LQ66_9APHY|nr:hypothetical protein EUX98_g9612 [Antrodiella citrinella]
MDDDAIPPLPPIDSDDELDDFHDIDDFDWSQPLPGEDSFDIPGPDILEEPASVRSQYQPHMSFYATYTDSVENNLSQEEIGRRSADVVTYMKRRGLNLAVFLNAIIWGNPICTSRADVQHERTTFMSSKYLKIVLENWWRPPGGAKSGQQVIQDFAVGCTQEVLTAEMNHIAPSMRPDDNPLEHDNLTSVDFEEFGTYLSGTGGAPILWMLLMSLAWGVRQAKENSLKSPFHVIMLPFDIRSIQTRGTAKYYLVDFVCVRFLV